MIHATFLRKLALVLVSLFFASCDKDYNTIGSDIIGAENFNFKSESFDVKAYNQKVTAVETNNLATNQLGVIANRNTVLGTTTANFVTQLSLTTVKPTFKNKNSIVVDSVVLTVPYFSTKIFTDTDGRSDYVLNAMYTTNTATNSYDPIDLKVFRSGIYLRDSDPVTLTTQKHYSDDDANFVANLASPQLNNDALATENTAFVPSIKEYKKYKVLNNEVVTPKQVESRDTPRMRLHLDKNYFYNNVIKAAAADLNDNNVFKSYFKGLYFQTTQIGTKGTSMILDFTKGDVTIYYKQDVASATDTSSSTPGPNREMASLKMTMTGNTVNLFNNTDNSIYTAAVTTPDKINGDSKLYLKGGQGSISFIELFPAIPGSTKQTLAQLKAKNVLVNEASLTFTVDKTGMTSDYQKPLRIYIFDADNNTPLYDYYFDNSTSTTNLLLDKATHGGIIETIGTKDIYKVRITQHINNILKETTGFTSNVRLGVVVSDNINTYKNGFLKTAIPDASTANPSRKFDRVPSASITNPLGTVLYGTNTGTPDNDIKFEIYYTEPK